MNKLEEEVITAVVTLFLIWTIMHVMFRQDTTKSRISRIWTVSFFDRIVWPMKRDVTSDSICCGIRWKGNVFYHLRSNLFLFFSWMSWFNQRFAVRFKSIKILQPVSFSVHFNQHLQNPDYLAIAVITIKKRTTLRSETLKFSLRAPPSNLFVIPLRIV
jgi:hypothetical protein